MRANRVDHLFAFDQRTGPVAGRWLAGVDEAGRGPLAGPVVAAAVILPEGFEHSLLNDSKQLTEKQRQELRPYIEKYAIFV